MRWRNWTGYGVATAMLLLGGAAAAQTRIEVDPWGRPIGRTERQGGTLRHHDAWGTYEGRSERSAGGGVLRHYDADGRYLGREEIPRDFRRRPPGAPAWGPNGPGEQGTGLQIYVDPGMLAPSPPQTPDFPPRQGTPWFGDRERPRR